MTYLTYEFGKTALFGYNVVKLAAGSLDNLLVLRGDKWRWRDGVEGKAVLVELAGDAGAGFLGDAGVGIRMVKAVGRIAGTVGTITRHVRRCIRNQNDNALRVGPER